LSVWIRSVALRGKVTRSWRRVFFIERRSAALVVISRRFCSLSVVLCQGESGSGASLGACDGSETLSRVRPVVRLMSDRESASGMAMPLFGSCGRPHAPKSDSECSETLCELIRTMSVLLKEREASGFCAEMIEIRCRFLVRFFLRPGP
jgi:hypothetical protein